MTLGRRGGDLRNVPPSVPVVPIERGGLATVHLPGQLVGYPLIDLSARGGSVKGFVHALEQGLIDALDVLGVAADRFPGRPGVWVGAAKIAAVGIHVRRGVTLHGVALNLCPDLDAFGWVVPCGLDDAGVTSVLDQTGRRWEPFEVAPILGDRLRAAFVDTLQGSE